MKKFSVKRKILEYCELQGVKKSIIAEKINVSPSSFAGSNVDCGLNSDAVVKFLREFPQISADWLLRDEGEMLKKSASPTPSPDPFPTPSPPPSDTAPTISAKDEVIAAKDEVIATQEKVIATQSALISALRDTIATKDTLISTLRNNTLTPDP